MVIVATIIVLLSLPAHSAVPPPDNVIPLNIAQGSVGPVLQIYTPPRPQSATFQLQIVILKRTVLAHPPIAQQHNINQLVHHAMTTTTAHKLVIVQCWVHVLELTLCAT